MAVQMQPMGRMRWRAYERLGRRTGQARRESYRSKGCGKAMTKQCKCGSYAINPHSNGRDPAVDLHLCDVCYWRTRAVASVKREPLSEMQIASIYMQWEDTPASFADLFRAIEHAHGITGGLKHQHDGPER